MNKFKYLKLILALALSFVLFMPFVSADEVYYTNLNGVTLNEEQYNRLVNEFGYNTIATMNQYQIDVIKDVTDFHTQEATKYIKTISYYDRTGELIQTVDTEITKEEYDNLGDIVYQPYAGSVSAEINGRILTLKVRSNGGETRVVTLHNKWKSIPSVKSFDVLAIRPGSSSYNTSLITAGLSGSQWYDGTAINYSYTSNNFNIVGSMTGNGGVGLSQNIVNSTSRSLENEMIAYFNRTAAGFLVYGTYQHATKDVTLAQSKNYSIHYSGYGHVVLFDSSVRNSYDGASGIEITYTYPNDDLA